jgi:hypothetical protein
MTKLVNNQLLWLPVLSKNEKICYGHILNMPPDRAGSLVLFMTHMALLDGKIKDEHIKKYCHLRRTQFKPFKKAVNSLIKKVIAYNIENPIVGR